MAIDVRWLEPQILLLKLYPPFTTKELNRVLEESIDMVNAIPDQVIGTVLDVKGIAHIPPGSIQKGIQLSRRKPDNAGPVVLIRAHPIFFGLARMVRIMHPPIGNLIHFADDEASGVRLLRKVLNISN